MFNLSAVKHDFGAAAATYDQFAQLQHDVRQQCLAYAKNYWQSGSLILDVGCGTGAFAEECKGQGWRVMGCDIAPGMCETALPKMPAVINTNAEALPFVDAAFDGVFSSLMLQWGNNPLAILREIARVLKPGAACALATLVDGTLCQLQESFRQIDASPHISDFLAVKDLSRLAHAAGLCIVTSKEETVTQRYPDMQALLHSLKRIGASNKHVSRRRGLMTPAQLRALETYYYRTFNQAGALPISWQVLYLVLHKG